MRQYGKLCAIVACGALMLFCFACAKKQVVHDIPAMPETVETGIATPDEQDLREGILEDSQLDATGYREITDPAMQAVFQDIRFDFDRFSIRPDARVTLKGIAEWMLRNPSTYLLIEGHCDERGTSEYNLALGERRANSTKKYLVQLGVAGNRIATISYGKEKPLDPRSNEEAWAKNRRCHFLIR
jgi:peptidoglycan-associated lipoprotein